MDNVMLGKVGMVLAAERSSLMQTKSTTTVSNLICGTMSLFRLSGEANGPWLKTRQARLLENAQFGASLVIRCGQWLSETELASMGLVLGRHYTTKGGGGQNDHHASQGGEPGSAKDELAALLSRLTYRRRECLKLYLGIGDGYCYTLEEIAMIFKRSPRTVRREIEKGMRQLSSRPVSVETMRSPETMEKPNEEVFREFIKDCVLGEVACLTYREREILKLRYGLGDGYRYTLEEVGRIFKRTRQRIHQVEKKAVEKLTRAATHRGIIDN